MTVPTLLLPRVAAKLEELGEAELAREVLALHKGKKIDGNTVGNVALAKLFLHLRRRIEEDGEDETAVLVEEARSNNVSYEYMVGIWTLDGRSYLKPIIRKLEAK